MPESLRSARKKASQKKSHLSHRSRSFLGKSEKPMNSHFKKHSTSPKRNKESFKESRKKESHKEKEPKTPEKDHTKKKSKDEKKKDDKHDKKLNSTRGTKPSKTVQPPSDEQDNTEDNLDDNQNLIQLTGAGPAPQQSVKGGQRKDSKKKDKDHGKEKDHAGSEVPGSQSVTGKNDTTAKKKKKKDKKDVPDSFNALAKAIESKTVEDMCAEFKVNHKPGCEELNRDTRYVLTFNVPPDSDFYDASRVDMPGNDCKFIAAAAPTTESYSMETFWRLVYDANVANIFYLEPAGKDFTQLAHFLPLEPTTSKDYGKMFVNNKKVERNPKEYQAVVEVLPEGCSNSIIVRFIQSRQWPDHVARKYRRIALHMVRTLKNEKSTSLIVCKDGRGRSGMFILLHSVITEVVGAAPDYKMKIPDSLGQLRQMRWGAIQTEQHYLLMYMLSLDFLVCKSKNFETQARNLEKGILEYIKKQKEAAKAATPKDSKEKLENVEKADPKSEAGKEKIEKKKKEKDEKKEPETVKQEAAKPDTIKQAVEAQTQFGQTPAGQAQFGQTQMAQTQFGGQTQLGQAQFGQTQLGQAQFGQNQVAQAQFGQAQVAQTQFGQKEPEKEKENAAPPVVQSLYL